MPQMSPMPWMLILVFTLTMLMFINSYIFFCNNKNYKFSNKFIKSNDFSIKW